MAIENPALAARLEDQLQPLLNRCVECGLCLPHCATWLATGNEVHSPRGRLLLLGHLLEQPGQDAPDAFLEAFDLCIGCRACEAVCPGGVPFSLLEHGQELAASRLDRTAGSAMGLPGGSWILRHMDSANFLGFLGKPARAARRLLSFLLGDNWRRKLERSPVATMARLLGTLPEGPGSNQKLRQFLDNKCQAGPTRSEPVSVSSASNGQTRVVFFSGCANEGLLPASSARLISLLRAAGCQVDAAQDQACCGALASHTGRPGRAAALKRKNQAALAPLLDSSVKIIIEAAGCGLEIKEKYGEEFANLTTDAVVLLAGLQLPRLGQVPLKVVYHDPCHARHGQGIITEPRQLLARIPGLQLLEPLEPDVCCGSGGAWGMIHQDLSSQLGRRKAADLAATGADLVVTSNPGCLGQIADGLAWEAPELPILPLTDLLWYAWQIADQP